MRFLYFLAIGLLLGGCAAMSPPPAGTPGASAQEEFEAHFSNISNVGATGITPVIIRISRWTTDAEQEHLLAVLSKEQTEGFVRELREMQATGSIGVPQELAYPLLYARQTRTADGGRRITLASDRPMTFQERMGSSVSRDYPLTWIELQLGASDTGTGIVVLAARLRLVGDVLGIEDLANQPARLTEVKKIR